MEQVTGCCVYCGQTKIVVGGDDMTEEQIDKQATLQCDCDEAQWLQRAARKKTYADANIKRLFADDGQMILNMLLELTEPLALQRIKKFTATTEEGIRATLTAKENSIKVERTEVKKSSLED